MRVGSSLFNLVGVTIGLVSLLNPHDAAAVASAEARIDNITINLVDLDLTDGLTPSITFSGFSAGGASADPLAGYPNRPDPDPSVYHYDSTPSFLGSVSVSTILAGMTVLASVSSNSLSAEASASAGAAQAVALSGVSYDSANGFLGFTLSPNSAFTITGESFIRAISDGSSSGQFYWENSHAGASAAISISAADGAAQFPDPTYSEDRIQVETPWEVQAVLQDSRHLTLTFTNSTDETVHGNLNLYVNANATAPVPEPHVIGLMFAGLAVLVIARRGKSILTIG